MKELSWELCEDIVSIANYTSISWGSWLYSQRISSNNVDTTHSIVQPFLYERLDVQSTNLSDIQRKVLLFFHNLAIKAWYRFSNDNSKEFDNYFQKVLNSNAIGVEISSSDCIDNTPHWDFEQPEDLLDHESFKGATIFINASTFDQELQIHDWSAVEYDAKSFTLTQYRRPAFSFTFVDARVLHKRVSNSSPHLVCSFILYVNPLTNQDRSRKEIPFIDRSERDRGMVIRYVRITNNMLITKQMTDKYILSDSIATLNNLRENLNTHLKDIDVPEIDMHFNNFVSKINKRLNDQD